MKPNVPPVQMRTPMCPPSSLWTDGSVLSAPNNEFRPPNPADTLITSKGAWLAYRDAQLILQGDVSLGSKACSFSMERTALRYGLADLHRLTTAPDRDLTCFHPRIVCDRLSVLAALQMGPMYMNKEDPCPRPPSLGSL